MSTIISKGSETIFYTLILENESGRQLNLSETANRLMFSKIEGLSPPAGTISTSSYAGMNVIVVLCVPIVCISRAIPCTCNRNISPSTTNPPKSVEPSFQS